MRERERRKAEGERERWNGQERKGVTKSLYGDGLGY